MKTVHLLEASDIDINNDPVHVWLMTMILISMLNRPDKSMEPMDWMKAQVAKMLNDAAKHGISIVPTDTSIPEVFRDA